MTSLNDSASSLQRMQFFVWRRWLVSGAQHFYYRNKIRRICVWKKMISLLLVQHHDPLSDATEWCEGKQFSMSYSFGWCFLHHYPLSWMQAFIDKTMIPFYHLSTSNFLSLQVLSCWFWYLEGLKIKAILLVGYRECVV